MMKGFVMGEMEKLLREDYIKVDQITLWEIKNGKTLVSIKSSTLGLFYQKLEESF
jgi:hypothetical protein